ncbi:hypothetical protein M409DRAFT_49147 [Zasmidium cellare ATCC 36951]|uniref:O-methyltransferase C-terminal domain-containing protein n=1 Tax=Zasmidium cellare ATCC 36951 TaxID=1080233 RepID=A0A6A6D7K8_ZASCE|nr:uncharacterized protein M409DRAFT_49147 [Zasmidium cellare ATCC 36951]KAF2174290.1 hypothetical protein M409DRAFT_49147 [Zasmidium cellare ATCC 36951]
MTHDFFTEQPIKGLTADVNHSSQTPADCFKGARIYYIHRVLHDWPEDKAREILLNLKPAFAQGHSRLVVNEVVLPPSGATSDQTSLDLTMMALVSGEERSEKAWSDLIEFCGFRI